MRVHRRGSAERLGESDGRAVREQTKSRPWTSASVHIDAEYEGPKPVVASACPRSSVVCASQAPSDAPGPLPGAGAFAFSPPLLTPNRDMLS